MVSAFIIGTAFRLAWTFAKDRSWVDKESRLVWTLSLGLVTIGFVSLLNSGYIDLSFLSLVATNF